MRFCGVVQAVAALVVMGSCSLWAAELTKTSANVRPPANARVALWQTIHDMNVEAVPMSRVIDYLRDMSGANIVVNWKVLESAGVAKEMPVSLQVRELSLRKMLQLVLDQVSPATQLTFTCDNNVIEITSQDEADKHLITKVYVVDDLVMVDNRNIVVPLMNLADSTKSGSTSGGSGGGTASGSLFDNSTAAAGPAETTETKGAELVALIRDVVRPNIWKENGGVASIRYFSGKLIVTAPASVQEAIGGPVLPEGGQRFGM